MTNIRLKEKFKTVAKKTLALLLVCCIMFSDSSILSVFAATTETNSTYTSNIDWSSATDFSTNTKYVMSSGTYILTADIVAPQPYIINSGVTINLNLNGYTITNKCDVSDYAAFDGDVYTDSIIFINGGTLNLYDETPDTDSKYYSATTNSDTAHYWDGEAIQNGTTTEEGYNYTGGAITGGYNNKKLLGGAGVCVSSGTFNMYSGNIVGNTTDPDEDGILGAGVYVNTGATCNIYGGTILGNTCSGNGGGLYNKGTTTIYDGIISRNSANEGYNYGGGLYNAGTMYINGGSIVYNYALGGGGISNVGTLYMSGGNISYNETRGSSGGVLVGWAATFTMTGGEISYNTTLGTAGGVGLKTYKGVFIMTGGEITGNTSGSYGGGVQVTNGDGFYIGGTASIIANEMTNGTDSNVWLDTDYYMTQISELTKTIGVTKAGGEGLISVSSTDGVTLNGTTYKYTITEEQTKNQYISDEVYHEIWDIDEFGDNTQYTTSAELDDDDDKVYLRLERVIEGTDQEEVYQAEPYDIEDLEFFNLTGLGSATYTVTPITGEGTFDNETNKLTVDKVGTFLIEVSTEYNVTEVPTTGSAILTITPKEVFITDLETVDRGPVENNVYVDLDIYDENNIEYGQISNVVVDDNNNYVSSSTYTSAIEGDDEVSIYYEDALATIDDKDYDNDETLNDDGTNDFAVTVTNLHLTGEDSENYVIVYIEPTTVTIDMSIPYIAWPTATDLVYGDTQNDDQLIGGKVIVKVPDSGYVEITTNGSFEWVTDNTNEENVGTYSYAVQFVEEEDKIIYDTTYHDTLSSTTQNITYSVNAAPVIFTIENSIVKYEEDTVQTPTITAKYGNETIDSTYYTIQYGKVTTNDDGTTTITLSDTTSGVGTYYVYASFTTNNYRHAGTTVSTGKQIGTFTIYAENETVETYTVTFQYENEEGSYTEITTLKITGAQYQDIHILPSVDTDKYYAWETSKGVVYEFGSRMTQQDYNMVLTAVSNPTTYTVSGTITGTDLDGTTNDKLDDIAVVLMQGNNLIASTVTGDDGTYKFENVEEGLYTIVVTRDQGVRNEISSFLDVSENTTFDLTLPDIRQNIILNVAAGLPDITVENMDSFFDYNEGENTFTVNITGIDIENGEKDEYDAIMEVAYDDGFTNDNLKEFFEITYTERPESEHTEFTYTDELLEYHIPLSGIYQGYEYYTIYRYNDGDIETITTVPNSNGEYMELAEDGQSITLYILQADIYGIAFTENEVTVEAGEDVKKVYQEESFDLTKLGMFDNIGDETETKRTDGTYTVEALTGEGTFDGDTSLDVTSIGTFEVTLTFPETDTEHREIYTAILTVTAKEVTIENLVAISQKLDTEDSSVSLDTSEGTITGIINNDDVSIDFSGYLANITTEDYYDTKYYTIDGEITGEGTFNVDVSGLTLTGEDAHNYILTTIEPTEVEIYFSIPYIAWPTSTNLTYLDQELPELNGGKVLIKDQDGFYTEITDDGAFYWVEVDGNGDVVLNNDGTIKTLTTFDADFTGDTSLYVMFIEDEDASGGYHDILKQTIQEVTFKIETAPVEFVITGNNIVVADENTTADTSGLSITAYYNNDIVSSSEYTIYYKEYDSQETATTTIPTTTGFYLISAEFNTQSNGTYHYNHIGTQESTGKQIGSLYIYTSDNAPTTYTVTFYNENGNEFTEYKISDANYQDIHILPDLTDEYGDTYSGWITEEGVSYDFNGRLPQQAQDYVLTAVETAESRTISGTVTGTDLNLYSDVPISNISVMLYSGGEIIATTTTNTDGYYSLTVPAGRYTIVFNRDQFDVLNEESVYIDATADDVEYDLVFPDYEQRIVLDIDASLPAITVDGMSYFNNYYEASYTHIDITAVSVSASEDGIDDTENITEVAYADGYSADTLKIFFDIEIDQTTYDTNGNATTTEITDLNAFFSHDTSTTTEEETSTDDTTLDDYDTTNYLLTFYIPLSGIYQGKESYIVFREHDVDDDGNIDTTTDIQTITYTPNADGEYIELIDNGTTIKMVVSKFSIYAIGFTEYTSIVIPTVGVYLGIITPIILLGTASVLVLFRKKKPNGYSKSKIGLAIYNLIFKGGILDYKGK